MQGFGLVMLGIRGGGREGVMMVVDEGDKGGLLGIVG